MDDGTADLRARLHDRLGKAAGDRVFLMALVMDRRRRASGERASSDTSRSNRADVKAELVRILNLPDAQLRNVAELATEALRRAEQAHRAERG